MKTMFISAVIAVFFLSVLFAAGCEPKGKDFGQPITATETTPISDILKSPDEFVGKTVLVEGTIIQECPAGGWFMLKDDTGVIYVNLHPSNFAIPQVVNRKVAAQGKVKKEYTQLSIIGEGVKLK
ncbi:MAG: hypothetical protein KKH29_03210 [Candidatus Omnitrophica bacterium]|nr:hypothetical protein [Candidatus Omnitrophota bacterium]MBU4473219.1 hypothetical protein [Candidatus Omnitrophota bacterium]MCG2706582.1 hypothetical protein [Candidatus Omnitrophota bacterium]